MNKFIIAAATVASLGLSVAANAADGRDKTVDVNGQSISQPVQQFDAQSPAVYEGRNATSTAPTTGVEPYIAGQIEGNTRSTR